MTHDRQFQTVLRTTKNGSKMMFLSHNGDYSIEWRKSLSSHLRIRNEYIRLFLAEFIGTFILMSVGIGCIAQAVLSKGAEGNISTITLGWGMAVMMGAYASVGVSGGHINPAITTAMVLLGRLPSRKMPAYLLGQYVGAFIGSLAVYVIYFGSLQRYIWDQVQSPSDEKLLNASSIWVTYPKSHVSTGEAFLDQVFTTGLLVAYVMAVTDERNNPAPKGLLPLVVSCGVMGVTTAFAFNCGAALNPARDLGPRLFTAIAGWGSGPFTFRDGNWFWVPVLGPHIGASLGALFYNICVGLHWPGEQEEKQENEEKRKRMRSITLIDPAHYQHNDAKT